MGSIQRPNGEQALYFRANLPSKKSVMLAIAAKTSEQILVCVLSAYIKMQIIGTNTTLLAVKIFGILSIVILPIIKQNQSILVIIYLNFVKTKPFFLCFSTNHPIKYLSPYAPFFRQVPVSNLSPFPKVCYCFPINIKSYLCYFRHY